MKQLISLITIGILMQCLLSGCTNQPKYPVGKDTVLYVSDGKYQIGTWPNAKKLVMFDEVDNNYITVLDEHVISYKRIKDTLYVIGDSYIVVSGKTNTLKIYSSPKREILGLAENQAVITYIDSYNNFSEAERKIFDKLKG
ncbi:hypothetical protein [Paenibacillus sp. MMO-58]|uniref:hypothetical protein n=1 Tax=Paenibacillus sp. MMO-58 TaxID=3081290 RepID=UPI0030172CCE